MIRHGSAGLLIACCAAVLAGCQKDEITVYRVAKEAPAPAMRAAPKSSLRWDLPRDWKELPASGMRLASFALSGKSREQVDISVTMFPGDAGGSLSNVNRWRSQIGLPPLEEAALARQSERLRTPAGEGLLVDFPNGGKRVVASIINSGGNSWFFKMTGDDRTIAAAKPAFKSLLKSLRPRA